MQQQEPAAPVKHLIPVKLFSAKYKSKRELWNFLAIECGTYLPAYDVVNIYFLRDLCNSKKVVSS